MLGDNAVSAVLVDGEVVRVRPLGPADADIVLVLHTRLDDRDRYLRFCGSPSDLSRLVRRMFAEPEASHKAVGAFRAGRLIGVAHYVVLGDSTEAEVALVVEGDVQSHGVGTLLLEHLISAARQNGLQRFVAQVLAENTKMVRVFTDLGLPYRMKSDGPLRELILSLAPDVTYRSVSSERERIADVASLRSVLRPASVAVIGASRDPGSVGRAVLDNLINGGYTGQLFAVNPHADEIAGVPCASSVAELPICPELAVICVPAVVVPESVEQCGRRGVRAAVLISAGLTGTDLATSVLEAARKYGMRLVGPNCVGVANTDPAVSMNATFVPGVVPAGVVGVVSQSGGFGIALLESLRHLGIGVSTMVSTGDKYDVSGNDLLLWWREDPRTDIAVLYLESFGNPRKFGWLARTLARTKPVLAVRTGGSEVARLAAASHTAAAATPVVTRDALYEQAGVIAVDTVSELVDTIAALSWQPLPMGGRVAVISNAGGAGVLAADACARHGLVLPELASATIEQLRALLPGQASLRNPIDTTAAVNPEVFGACLEAVQRDDGIDAVIVASVPTALGDPSAVIASRVGQVAKPVLAVRLGQLGHVAPLTGVDGGTVTASYGDPADAAATLGHLSRYALWRQRPPGVVPELSDINVDRARELVHGQAGWLGPLETMELLRCFGIAVVDTWLAADEDAATEVFQHKTGPVAAKAYVEGLLHKSTQDGVALAVANEASLRDLVRNWRMRFGAAWRGVVIQHMAPPGRELLIGVTSDDVFGPLVVFGLGGTDTDLVADRAAGLAPLTDTDADRLITSLRSSPTLFGSGELNVPAIRDVLLRVSRLAELLPGVAELDLNPVRFSGNGYLVLDARIRVEQRTPSDPFLRRLRT